jgi:hypothetical protein
MKLLLWIAAAHALLVGIAIVLLRTEQAPDLPPPEAPKPIVQTTAELQAAAEKAAREKEITTEKFRTMAAEAMSSMPKQGSESAESPIYAASQRVALILEKSAGDPALQEEARILFQSCSLSVQYSDAIKALCYLNFRNLSRTLGKEVPNRMVGKHIRDLADQLEK